MKNPHRHAPLALVCISLLIATADSAERVPGPLFDPVAYQQRLDEGPGVVPAEVTHSPAELKMSSQLASLFNPDLRPPGGTVEDVKAAMLRLGQIRSPGGGPDELHVYVHVTEPAALDAVRPEMVEWVAADPAWPIAEWPMIAGWVRETDLEPLAMMESVVFIQTVDPPRFRSGSVITEGDALHHGPQARGAPYFLDGTGIKVGVISDGVANLAAAQASGDLPLNVTVLGVGSGDEGTAMLEIIHDLAPAAELYFAPSGGNMTSFGNAVAALHLQGCHIICDDVGFYNDNFFEHSPLGLQIGNLQSLRDYLHVSAAGNDAELHHQQVFTDANGDGWHDPYLIVNVPPGGVLDVFMQWKEPRLGTPQSDYDLYLYDYNTLALLAPSVTRNQVGETIYYTNNTSAAIDAAVYVWRHSGTTIHEIEIFIEPQNGALQYTNGTSPVDAIFGHPGFGSVFAVVATDVADPTQIEWFSSQGPFTIIAHPQFQPKKPDFAGADGVTVSGAGGFASPFFGTSAAAPHVAGVQALAWSRNPGAQAAEFRIPFVMSQSCVDLGSPGFDTVFGWGRPQADLLAGQFNEPPVATASADTIHCVQQQWKALGGLIEVSDPDAGTNPVVVTLTVSGGIIGVAAGIPGGVAAHEIQSNGSMQVVITAGQNAIQTTLDSLHGVEYRAHHVPPGPPQTDTLLIGVNDQGYLGMGGALTDTASLNLMVHENGYEAWRHGQFTALELLDPSISGDDANPDGDLFDNRWEFFIGGDPLQPDHETTPSCSMVAGQFVMRFRMSMDIPEHAIAIKGSEDLVNWIDVPPHDITSPWPQHPTVPDAWLMEVKRPPTASGREFLRIEFDPRF